MLTARLTFGLLLIVGLTACTRPAGPDAAVHDAAVRVAANNVAASTDADWQLAIIHINDTHSQFDPSPAKVELAPGEALYTFIGGHPRLLTKARQLQQRAQAAGTPSLFLHGGDAFKGSAYFELFEHQINIDILNRMQLDAMALGNHEFDIGLPKLAQFASEINFPLLAANVDTRAEPLLAGVTNLKPYQLYRQQGERWQPIAAVEQAEGARLLAIFGVALEDMRTMVPDTGALEFSAEITAAQQTVDHLTALGVPHIIALTHLGHQRDLNLATWVNGIDVIVGGHSHSLLGDFRHWYLGQQPPYAQQVPNPDGQGITCVVQAGQYAQAIGALTVSFNLAGQVTACQGQNTLLAGRDYYPSALRRADAKLTGAALSRTLQQVQQLANTAIVDEDPLLREVLDTVYLPAVQQAYGTAISSTERSIAHVRLPGTGGSDQHGSELAGHIADAMLNYVNTPAVQALVAGPVQLSLIGAGNIRSHLEAGTIYEGHIRLEVLPFDTPLSVLTVSGADLLALLQQTISATLPPGAHAGKFPYGSGLRYVARQEDDYSASVAVEVWQEQSWQALDPQREYRLVTTNYLANGNDGWQQLQQAQAEQTDRRDIILLNGQPKAFVVERVTASLDSRGQPAFTPVYQGLTQLPCGEPGVDCKTAAQAVIDHLQAQPDLWQRTRPATVTLYR